RAGSAAVDAPAARGEAGGVAPAAERRDGAVPFGGRAAAVLRAGLVRLVGAAGTVTAVRRHIAAAAVADADLALGLLPEAAVLRAGAAVARTAGAGLAAAGVAAAVVVA